MLLNRSPQQIARVLISVLGFAALYFLLAHFGLKLASFQENASPVWPASGLAVALVLANSKRYWFSIWLGAWVANLLTSTSWFASALIATGSTGEALIAALVIQYLLESHSEWKLILRSIAFFVGALFGSALSSIVGGCALLYGGQIDFADFQSVAGTWFVGDALGILIVGTLLAELTLQSDDRPRRRLEIVEYLLFALVLGGLTFQTFLERDGFHQLFLFFPLLLWAAIRFKPSQLMTIVFLIAAVAIYGTTLGLGPFHTGTLNQNLISLQLFLASLALTGISLREFAANSSLGLPSAALMISWSLSGLMFFYFEDSIVRRDREHFQRLVGEALNNIDHRTVVYKNSLVDGSSFLTASGKVTPEEWSAYVDDSKLAKRYPAILGLGAIWPVKTENLNSFTSLMRRSGLNEFKIKAVPNSEGPPQDTHLIITYIEPISRNRKALGLDVSTDSRLLTAAEKSRDLGVAVASENVQLMQDELKRPGFYLFSPFYSSVITDSSTKQERRKAIEGWVFAPFVLDSFFEGSIGSPGLELHFSVLGDVGSRPLYSSGAAGEEPENFELISEITLCQRDFKIGWSRSNGFVTAHDAASAWVAAAGAFISILIAMVVSVLQSLGHRADEIAKRRTSELAASEAELRRTAFRLNSMIEVCPVGIVCLDLNRRITLWNPACEKIFGFSQDEVMGRKLPFVPGHLEDESRLNFEAIHQDEKPFVFQADRRHKNGSQLIIRVAIMPVHNAAGIVEGGIAMMTDLTEELRAQRELELERASAIQNARMAAIGEMAGGIAHEINNPLAIIGGQATFLKMEIEKGGEVHPAMAAEALNKIESVVYRISKIIKGLRTFSRRSEDEPKTKREVSTLVRETLEFCQERFRNHGVRLELVMGAEVAIECQSVQISQVLLNLLNNAFDAVSGMPDPWVKLEVVQLVDTVRIGVSDNGHGIPTELREKIMEPFFTLKPVGQGTGLGLSIARGIVEQHGGRLFVDPQSENTCLVMELPI